MAKKKTPGVRTPQSSFRLPAETKAKIQELCDRYLGTSQAKVLIRAVDEMHAREFGPSKAPKKNPKSGLDVS